MNHGQPRKRDVLHCVADGKDIFGEWLDGLKDAGRVSAAGAAHAGLDRHAAPQRVHRDVEDRRDGKRGSRDERDGDRDLERMTPSDKKTFIAKLTTEMRRASRDLNFELAAKLRDLIATLQ